MSHIKYLDMDLDQVVSFYIKEALNKNFQWGNWFIDAHQNKVIFKYWEPEDSDANRQDTQDG
jgi:hypothetical protein